MLPTLGITFRPVLRKKSAAEKKIRSLSNIYYLMAFGHKKKFICVYVPEKSMACLWFSYCRITVERITGGKLNFEKFGPFSALSVQNRPKFGRSFVRPLYFSFGPFWVMRRNIRPVDNTEERRLIRGVTKRSRLSLLTNRPSYMSPNSVWRVCERLAFPGMLRSCTPLSLLVKKWESVAYLSRVPM